MHAVPVIAVLGLQTIGAEGAVCKPWHAGRKRPKPSWFPKRRTSISASFKDLSAWPGLADFRWLRLVGGMIKKGAKSANFRQKLQVILQIYAQNHKNKEHFESEFL
jgi:hypothetical protein